MPLPFTRRGIDPDAADFCSRSGASDRAAVSAFVRGVKDLGLWESMVCWPLRSEQNAGTGDIVYSLGGLGTFNGTRVNGPTWGADGVNFIAANDTAISTGFKQAFNVDKTWIAAAKFNAPAGAVVPRLIGQDGAAESELTVNVGAHPVNGTALNTWSGSGAVSSTRSINFTTTSWHEYGVSFDYANTTARYLFDGTTEDISRASSIGSNTDASIGLGQNNANNWDGPIAYVLRISSSVSASQMIALGSIAKSTLGIGLGLP